MEWEKGTEWCWCFAFHIRSAVLGELLEKSRKTNTRQPPHRSVYGAFTPGEEDRLFLKLLFGLPCPARSKWVTGLNIQPGFFSVRIGTAFLNRQGLTATTFNSPKTWVFPGTKVSADFCLVWKMNFNLLLLPRRVPHCQGFFYEVYLLLASDLLSDLRSDEALLGPDIQLCLCWAISRPNFLADRSV